MALHSFFSSSSSRRKSELPGIRKLLTPCDYSPLSRSASSAMIAMASGQRSMAEMQGPVLRRDPRPDILYREEDEEDADEDEGAPPSESRKASKALLGSMEIPLAIACSLIEKGQQTGSSGEAQPSIRDESPPRDHLSPISSHQRTSSRRSSLANETIAVVDEDGAFSSKVLKRVISDNNFSVSVKETTI